MYRRIPAPFAVVFLGVTLAACDVPSDFGNRPDDPSVVRLAALRALLEQAREAEVDRVGAIRADALADLGLSLYPTADGTTIPPEYVGKVLVRDPETLALEVGLGDGPEDGVRVRLYERALGNTTFPLHVVGEMNFRDDDDPLTGPALAIDAELNGAASLALRDRTYEPGTTLSWVGTIGPSAATTLAVEVGPADAAGAAGGTALEVVLDAGSGNRAVLDLAFDEEGGAVQGTLSLETRTTLADAAGFGVLFVEAALGGTAAAPTIEGAADLTVTSNDGGWQFFHQVDLTGPLAGPAFAHADGDPLSEAQIVALQAYWAELVTLLRSLTAAQGLPSPLP